jgi:CDP-diacylglycerol--serine O-phosphatidyltransferase
MKGVMLALSVLMISHVLYPALPRLNVRSARGLLGAVAVMAVAVAVIMHPYRFAFPALVLYVAYGLVRSMVLGAIDRLPTGDPLYDSDEDEVDDAAIRPVAVGESPLSWRRRRRRRGRRGDRFRTPPTDRPSVDADE